MGTMANSLAPESGHRSDASGDSPLSMDISGEMHTVGRQPSVLSALYWAAGGRFAGQLLSWLITLWVIRILAPADYALMALAMVFIAACALFDEVGLGSMITRARELDETSLRKAFGIVLTIKTALFGVLLVAAPAVGWLYASEELVPLVRLLAFNFLASALGVIPRALLERHMAFQKLMTA